MNKTCNSVYAYEISENQEQENPPSSQEKKALPSPLQRNENQSRIRYLISKGNICLLIRASLFNTNTCEPHA